jgi:hypothetical protein
MKRRGLVIILASAMSFPVAAAEKQSEQSLGSQQQTLYPEPCRRDGINSTKSF